MLKKSLFLDGLKIGALAAAETLFVSPLVAEKMAAELFNPVPFVVLPEAAVGDPLPKPPNPPMPLVPPKAPKPPELKALDDPEVAATSDGLLPGAPTPIGDFDGEGGATGSPLVSKCVLTDGGKDELLLVDILYLLCEKGEKGEKFSKYIYFIYRTSFLVCFERIKLNKIACDNSIYTTNSCIKKLTHVNCRHFSSSCVV